MAIRRTARLIALSCTAVTVGVAAQIALPPAHLPSLPSSALTSPIGQTAAGAAGLGAAALASPRRAAGEELIRRNRQLIEADPNGEPMLRGQLLALDLSSAALERIVAAGFMRVSEQSPDGPDTRIDVLRAPHGMSTQGALRQLRRLEPGALFDYDHLYAGSASAADADTAMAATADIAPAPAPASASAPRRMRILAKNTS
jgi:hypothetical protein